MAFHFKQISDTEFHVNNHVLTFDSNGNWTANPPIESNQLKLAVNRYITTLKN